MKLFPLGEDESRGKFMNTGDRKVKEKEVTI